MTFEDVKREIGRRIIDTMIEKTRYSRKKTDFNYYVKIDESFYCLGSEQDWDNIDNDWLLWNRPLGETEDEVKNNQFWESNDLEKEIESFVEAYATQWNWLENQRIEDKHLYPNEDEIDLIFKTDDN